MAKKRLRDLTYVCWSNMKNRCQCPTAPTYKYYGGRGIIVCQEWQTFEGFLKDMGPKPDGMELDRICNDSGYYKENCRWSTPLQNKQNQRRPEPINDPGVYIYKNHKKPYRAKHEGKWLGFYSTVEEAKAAITRAAKKLVLAV